MAEFFWSNGVVMLLIEEAKAASLLKLLLFVVIGLALLENILPSFKAEFEVTDSPSGGGLGPEGIENSGLFSRLSSRRGKPRPALAQLTSDKRPLKASATGETKLSRGKIHSLQIGHVYPAGAVSFGNDRAYLSKQTQWNT